MSRKNRGLHLFLPILTVITCSHIGFSQNSAPKERVAKIFVITSFTEYQNSIESNPEQRMVLLKSIDKSIVLDLKYSTAINFTHTILYKTAQAWLRLPAALALKKINAQLKTSGLALKIFDAYRPYTVTQKMWDVVKDRRYVANPKKGSGHNRGASVDLTIIDLKTGKELDMGTGFDDFTEKAGHNYKGLPPLRFQRKKAKLLNRFF